MHILASYRFVVGSEYLVFLRIRLPPIPTRPDNLFPSTTLFRSRLLIRNGPEGRHRPHFRDGEPVRARGRARTRHSRRAARPDADTRVEKGSEEHTSELQSLMRISYAVFCLKKKKKINTRTTIKQLRST